MLLFSSILAIDKDRNVIVVTVNTVLFVEGKNSGSSKEATILKK